MERESDYLLIPPDYAAWLGGVRWSRAGDAVEYEDEVTFALAPQVGLFVEGLTFGSNPLHFAHVLHLLKLLGFGRGSPTVETENLRAMQTALANYFRATGRPLRNAGALCSFLCRAMPTAAATVELKQICTLLWSSSLMAEVVARSSLRTAFHLTVVCEEAPLSPTAFETRFLTALSRLSPVEIDHWLRHGEPPQAEAAEQIAEAIPPPKPRTLGDVLDELSKRERLGGALPYVAQMVSALSLPPRRLDHSELPIGGYSDVTTRGRPEQLLPSQFAVEDLEFVRRFAQNELLYFRREEPTSQVREELVLLLDQGVRAWGTVRVLLAAAALAFGRLAQRRRLPLFLAGTSSDGSPLSVLDTELAELGKLVDASDLSLNPGRALERTLEDPAEGLRDIVLLTHPRALAEEDVIAAARRAPADTRLFALTITDRGEAQLSELRHGVPVKVRQFHVDLRTPAKVVGVKEVKPAPVCGWTGCVEPIGFPFRIGIMGPIEKFAFDYEGKTLLTVSQGGILHAWRLDGGMEMLPRPSSEAVMARYCVGAVGVRGGFVLAYRCETGVTRFFAYDLGRRSCERLPLAPRVVGTNRRIFYIPALHCIVTDVGDNGYEAVDLATRSTSEKSHQEGGGRARNACDFAAQIVLPPPQLSITRAPRIGRNHVCFGISTGNISVRGVQPEWQPFTPMSDGMPVLAGQEMLRAQCSGDTFAATFGKELKPPCTLRVYGRPDGAALGQFSCRAEDSFLLSPDGRLLARQSAQNQVVVHEINQSPAPVFVTARGRCHSDLYVEQGHHKMVVQIGNWLHLIRWDRGPLELVHAQGDRHSFLRKHLGGVEPRFPGKATRLPCMAYDSARFRYAVQGEVDVVVDVFGQLAVLDRGGTLIAMFFVFRNQIAAWMPDGTRYGPASLVGGPGTEGALEALGRALSEACRRGGSNA